MMQTGLERPFLREYPYTAQVKDCIYFNNHLKKMVSDGEMFAAIREKTLDFYFLGRRALRRTRDVYRINQFYTDSVSRKKSPEIPFKPDCPGFEFLAMLEHCEKKSKSGSEGLQISKLYKPYSFLSNYSDNTKPLLIDTEVRFSSLSDKAKNDRIDLAFFMPKQEALMFVEVKRKSDSRIRAKKDKRPDVVEQVAKYNDQIKKRGENILQAYNNAAGTMRDIFGKSYPEIKDIIPYVPILVVDDPDVNPANNTLSNHVKDTWLEPELANLTNTKIWKKDGVHLIDGRQIFYEAKNGMPQLAGILEDIAAYK